MTSTKQLKGIIVFLLCIFLLNFSISAFLAYQKAQNNIESICIVGEGGCSDIQNTTYAYLYGIPLTIWGVAFFSLLSALFSLFYLSFMIERLHQLVVDWKPSIVWFIDISLLCGALGAAWFLYIQFFILNTICVYCQVIDWSTILAALLYFIFMRRAFEMESYKHLKNFN